MSDKALVESINKIAGAFKLFEQRQDERIADMRNRLEELEARGSMPGATGGGNPTEDQEHRSRFEAWLRKPYDTERKNALGEMEGRISRKDVSIGSNPGGGFAVPKEIAREIERLELLFSPVRRLVKVMRASTSDFKHLVNVRGATSGWVGEGDNRTKTATSLLRERTPTMGEIYAYPEASEWSFDDVFFNVAQWLAEEAAQAFAQDEGLAVISGDGTNKPTGMLDTAPDTTPDFASPLRDADRYQFIPCLSTQSPAVAEILPDCLIDLLYSLNSMYRVNGTWVMNSATAGAIRKLKDAEGRYLWADGITAGQPNMLLGYPVAIWEQMSDIGTNNHPVAFGDFRRGYLLVDRTDLRITPDEVTKPGFRKFYIRRREAGTVLNCDAIKWLKTTIA